MAMAIQWIYDRVGLVTGGFTGIAIVLRTLTVNFADGGIPLWFTNLVLNIPLFAIALFCFGKRYIGRTAFATVMLSVWLYVLPVIDLSGDDYMLSALFGGVLFGLGFGLVLRAGATTGGTDTVAALIHKRVRHYTIAQILQFLDGVIVLLGLYVYGLRPSLYAVVSIFVITKVSDAFLEGLDRSKAAIIITEKHEEVSKLLMDSLDRGLTGIEARGMYTQEYKCVLYCVVSRKEIVQLKELVARVDPKAFVIVSDVREVLGEGFGNAVSTP
jgi:uncharacterized membrane-anchored protein YitT (DUF2179 family)